MALGSVVGRPPPPHPTEGLLGELCLGDAPEGMVLAACDHSSWRLRLQDSVASRAAWRGEPGRAAWHSLPWPLLAPLLPLRQESAPFQSRWFRVPPVQMGPEARDAEVQVPGCTCVAAAPSWPVEGSAAVCLLCTCVCGLPSTCPPAWPPEPPDLFGTPI